jgi:hypothetical protein
VVRLRDAGVAVEGIARAIGDGDRVWDPSRFDEIVVSCAPWVSLRTRVYECDSTAS